MTTRVKVIVIVLGLVGLSSTGCFDSILTAASKILNGQLSQLSANEIAILNQFANDYLKGQNPNYQPVVFTQQQDQALANFLKANNINTAQDLTNVINNAKNGGSVQGLNELADAFPGYNVDPNNPDDQALLNLFNHAFAGQNGYNGGGGQGGN